MKIVYYSSLPFTDCDFPLIKGLQEEHEIYYVLPINSFQLKSSLINIRKQIKKTGIFNANIYKEFNFYSKYLNLEKVFILNRPHKSVYHIKNIILIIQFIYFLFKIKPQIIHFTLPPNNLELLLYLFFRKKMVLTLHDPFLHSGEKNITREFYRKIAFKLIPKIILLNQSQKIDFIKHYKISTKKIFINQLGNYECINLFLNTQQKKNEQQIIFFGRISPYKGIEYLCEAMVEVHKILPDLKCVIAGSGKYYFDISKYQNLKYILIYNRYIGMDELAKLINNSLFTVCPYTDATQSGVIQTSLALNIPIMATKVGGLGEKIKNGHNGILIEEKCNSKVLADSIISLVRNHSLRETMKENIKKDNKDGESSWKQICKKYINIYNYSV